jgi:hypothetical protein
MSNASPLEEIDCITANPARIFVQVHIDLEPKTSGLDRF